MSSSFIGRDLPSLQIFHLVCLEHRAWSNACPVMFHLRVLSQASSSHQPREKGT